MYVCVAIMGCNFVKIINLMPQEGIIITLKQFHEILLYDTYLNGFMRQGFMQSRLASNFLCSREQARTPDLSATAILGV